MAPDDIGPRPTDAFWRMYDDRGITANFPFKDMSETQAQDMLDCATIQRINPDALCFEEGNTADRFYLLLDGVVQIVRTTAEGEQVIVLHIVPGQMFGIAKAFENDTYRSTARVVLDGTVLSWPSHLWNQFSQDYPGFLIASRQAVGVRFDDMQEKIVSMATLQVEQRIAQAILDLVQRTGVQTKDGIEISFPITRQDISEMTGTTLHSVSRYMSKWQKNGIVTSKRKRVIVRRPDALPV